LEHQSRGGACRGDALASAPDLEGGRFEAAPSLRTFKISNDPHFAEKVCDVVWLYMNPPDNALVLSVDEKIQIQDLDRIEPK